NHLPNTRLHLKTVLRRREISFNLPQRNILQAAPGISAVLGMAKRATADIRRENLDLPCLDKFQRVAESYRHRVRLFARRAPGAPDPKRSRAVPKFPLLRLGQNSLLERLKNSGVPKKRRLLRKQPLEQLFVFDTRAAHESKELRAAGDAFLRHEFAETR